MCLGFTSFRPETLPYAESKMHGFSAIVLEEPQTPGFEEMLRGVLSVEDYLLLTDFAFVRFAEESCGLMRRLYRKGAAILQVDPYMDELVRIHEYFASGGSPEGIEATTLTGEVYACERIWTGRLLDFYRSSRKDDFRELVETIKAFARIDAERGLFRNRLRADALEALLPAYSSIYVEAGYLHLSLQKELLSRPTVRPGFESFYVLEPVMRDLMGRKQLFTPGDLLTFLYTFGKAASDSQADTLAARSLVYNKIVAKEELPATESDPHPHARDEVRAVSLANAFSFESCRAIYPRIRSLPTAQALEAVKEWLASGKGRGLV